jgi:1-acyl-sn-glycerol-3-phosphate acyltransferase
MGPAAHALSLVRLAGFLLLTMAAIPVQVVCLALGPSWSTWFPPHYHGVVARLLGFRIRILGRCVDHGPALVVSNHLSYFDAVMLASTVRGSFIAKADVARWPFIGFLAKLQRSEFIERKRRHAGVQRDALGERLAKGDILVLFAEGTSTDGLRVGPFKTTLFAVAETRVAGKPITVQPVTVAFTRLNGMPLGRMMRPYLAWYGDMTFFSHLWTAAGLGITEVRLEFHAPVTIEQFGSRKRLAEHCRDVIAASLEIANTGRARAAAPPAASIAEPVAVAGTAVAA